MTKRPLSLLPLLTLVFACGLLAGCNNAPDEATKLKNETPEQKQLRQEKKGD
jgi:hypothetical protein